MNELDIACLKFKQALANPYAVERREEYKKAQREYLSRAWKLTRKNNNQ